jgi:putative drug exporter of the RND superfamily
MSAVSRFVLRHKRVVVVFWLVVLVAGGAASARLAGRLSGQFPLPGTMSYQANQQILQLYGNGGSSYALLLDENHAFYGRFPLLIAVLAAVTILLLARAFGSLLLPVKAVILNLASVGATYGVIVLVWQHGHGSQAIWGIPATGAITNWVPLIAFAFLYGLSMDYEVFILTRIREERDRTGSTDTGITEGIARTGRLVTGAAVILFLAFAALSTGPETDLKVAATALGAGILLDATVVRGLLVPALIAVLGRWNWWLPAPAARLLRIPATPAAAEPAAVAVPAAARQQHPR